MISPTRERVAAMLKGTSHSPDEVVVEYFPPAEGKATVKSIAINAVMAGAKPEHLPVILAATESMAKDPNFIVPAQSTSPHALLFLVNGPIIKQLGFNYLAGTLGPGSQSWVNIVIGRSTRLIMMNVGGAYVGVKDMDTIGAANKFSLVAAENEDDLVELGWKPFHVENGFNSSTSTITGFRVVDQNEIFGMATANPEGILASAANDIGCIACGIGVFAVFGSRRNAGDTSDTGGAIILFSGDDARLIQRGGWKTKDSIRKYLADHICLDKEAYIKYFLKGKSVIMQKYPTGNICGVVSPENIHIFRVGYSPGKSAFYRGGGPQIVSIDKWR